MTLRFCATLMLVRTKTHPLLFFSFFFFFCMQAGLLTRTATAKCCSSIVSRPTVPFVSARTSLALVVSLFCVVWRATLANGGALCSQRLFVRHHPRQQRRGARLRVLHSASCGHNRVEGHRAAGMCRALCALLLCVDARCRRAARRRRCCVKSEIV